MAFEKEIDAASKATGLPRDLILKLIQTESSGNPKAVSSAGAQGLTQLMPGTAKEMGVTDPFDPGQSIGGGAGYLKKMVDRFGLRNGVAAYNFGPGNVASGKAWPAETQNYVDKMLGQTGGDMGSNGNPNKVPTSNATTGGFDLSSILGGLMKPSKGEKIGNILGGLSEVVGSMNKWNGAQYQQQAQAANMARKQMAQTEKTSGLASIMSLMKGDSTDDIKEFNFAKQGGFSGSFEDFLKIKPSAGAPMIPGMEGLYPILIDKIKKSLGGGVAPAGPKPPADLGNGITFEPAG